MASTNISYLACGFYEDCFKLIEIFKQNSSSRFDVFCKAWQEMKFSLVFLCRKNYAEMLEFCEESLNIVKQFLLLSNDLIDQIGGLYLLYGLYNKIPVENVKIQVTFKEWRKLLNLHKQIKDENLYDASYIFVKLVMDNAFHYCLFEAEYGLEKTFKFRQELSLDNPYSILPSLVDEIENGELAKIKKFSKIYDDQKSKILNNVSSTNKLQLFDKNFMNEIINEIETLQDKRQTLTGLRKKVKEVTLNNKTEKNRHNFDDKIRPKLGHGFDTDSSDDENIEIEFAFVKPDHQNLPKHFDENENDDDILDEKTENDGDSKMKYFKEGSDDEMSQ